ncbi:MAG: hypothetical protein ACM3JB_22045, partial [Acidobacteriaceae bacterium]
IRSGVSSAMNSNSSSAPAPSNASEDTGNRQLAVATSGSRGHSSYRPHSVSQVISYNVAKALGKAASRNNAENN